MQNLLSVNINTDNNSGMNVIHKASSMHHSKRFTTKKYNIILTKQNQYWR